MSEWQPIETAPKDGTIILVCGHTAKSGYYVADVKWDCEWMIWHHDTDEYTEPSWGHTHWMPLPSPPAPGSDVTPTPR